MALLLKEEQCQVTIGKVSNSRGDGEAGIEITVRQGRVVISKVEMTMEGFARAQFGESSVDSYLLKRGDV